MSTRKTPHRPAPSDVLTSAGLRATPARLAALSVLQTSPHAMSHADIEAGLSEPLDRVTLYRTLESFVDAGLATRTVGSDRVSRFAWVDNAVDHHAHAHFECDDCGRTFCLPAPAPKPKPSLVPQGFAVTSAELSFHGHCPDCQAKPTGRR